MQWTAFAVSLSALEGDDRPSYEDESQAMHAALLAACKQRGLAAANSSNTQALMEALAAADAGALRQVMHATLRPDVGREVIEAELNTLTAAVQQLQLDMASVKSQLAVLAAKRDTCDNAPPPGLAKYLAEWWVWRNAFAAYGLGVHSLLLLWPPAEPCMQAPSHTLLHFHSDAPPPIHAHTHITSQVEAVFWCTPKGGAQPNLPAACFGLAL
jgi:hypothetical protein